jgi:uncharacterized repeat protein (TIGR03803 family)
LNSFPVLDASGGVAKITTLAAFYGASSSGTNGAAPYCGLLQAADGNFYGTTHQGGTSVFPGLGTVFKLTPGGVITTLFSFNNTNGSRPYAALTQGIDGGLYGSTLQGGTSNFGTLFRINTNGALTTLLSFTNTNGARPSGRLTLGQDGFFYGTTQFGGPSNQGTVFRVTTNGVLTTLASFFGTNGANPYAEVVQGIDGRLYGTTVNGGTENKGTVFQLTTNGVLTRLISFDGTNGFNPYGGLVQDPGGILYGTTANGGAAAVGTVFRITTNGALVTLHEFSGGDDGSNPWASLLRGRDGSYYGTTILGGSGLVGRGTVFQITTNGDFATLASFEFDANGGSPYGGLVQDSSGHLYGTTLSLGVGLKGTVFRLDPAPTTLSASVSAGLVRIGWAAWLGQSYQVQYKTNLLQNNWTDLANPITATNGAAMFTDPISGPSRQYRLKQTTTP